MRVRTLGYRLPGAQILMSGMHTRLTLSVALLAGSAFGLIRCSDSPVSPVAPNPAISETPVTTRSFLTAMGPQILVGSGDIARCGSPGSELTARLLDATPGTVFTTGDNVYETGTREEYRDCYTPTWGRHRDRTRPSPGNHEYETPGASPYYEYFGDRAGSLRHRLLQLRAWQLVDSFAQQRDRLEKPDRRRNAGCTTNSLHTAESVRSPTGIVRSSRPESHGPNADMRDLWRTLYGLGNDVVVSGHDHLYERFAPQDPNGRRDPQHGVRQFIVGTGGGDLTRPRSVQPNSEARESVWGVLKLTLTDDAYDWQFLPAEAGAFHDSGSSTCH